MRLPWIPKIPKQQASGIRSRATPMITSSALPRSYGRRMALPINELYEDDISYRDATDERPPPSREAFEPPATVKKFSFFGSLSSMDKRTIGKKILRFLFSHVGLCLLNITYMLVGSLIFIALESYQDTEADDMVRKQINASRLIETRRESLIELVIRNASSANVSAIETWLNEYHALIAKEIVDCSYKRSITEIDFVASDRWSFSSVMVFVLSIVSSVGYGHIYPKDDGGYLMVIIYGLFGIPFFVMSLGSIGSGMAAALKFGYQRGCCWAMNRRRRRAVEEASADDDRAPPRSRAGSDGRARTNSTQPDSVPLTLALATVIIYAFLGGSFFAWKEQWTFVTSIYFCVVTLFTVGFGDYVPGVSDVAISDATAGQLSIVVCFLYIIAGLALVSMTLNVAVDLLRERMTKIVDKVKIWEGSEEDDIFYL